MSAHSESAATPAPCACTNISLMQLFHELKQKFPAVPDHVVSHTIELYCHDKQSCETHLQREAKASLTHAYHASSSAAARQLNEIRVSAPQQCPNQPIVKHELQTPVSVVHAVSCQEPQTATLSLSTITEPENTDKPQITTDANQNVVENKDEALSIQESRNNNIQSPVTVINIDNCVAKYSAESPSDLELTNEIETVDRESIPNTESKDLDQPEGINYRILKSNKVKSNLHEKLEKCKEKKTIRKEEPAEKEDEKPAQNIEKPKRPNTLEFLKPKPDIAFKETLQEPKVDNCKSISPTPSAQKQDTVKETTPGGSFWPGGYPLNLSVNVNCHMDYGRGYDQWLDDYNSPRAITSVNLTVCTPTSNMASPVRDDDGGFEGHVTVTVSPNATRPPRRRAPAPPQQVPQSVESQRSTRSTLEASQERTLIERQKERLGRLRGALMQERGRISQLTRETQILAGAPPSPAAARRLREYVHRLRDQCGDLAKRVEMTGHEPDSADFYSNIYTGQRPRRPARPAPPPPPPPAHDEAPPWQCHVCTFRNHGLLDKCEECEMPRILVGTSPARTLDSGFGSFRDRNRRVSQVDVNTALFTQDVPDCPPRACV